jgi:PKD repeat protein
LNLFLSSASDFRGGYTVNNYSDGNWHHVVAIFDQGLDTLKCYVDGYIVGMVIDHVTPTWPNPDNTGYEVINPSLSSDTIKVDEIRFYKTLPTEDDILTQFNNQNDPATFSLCGPEESNLVADFSASPLSGVASLSVQFTDTSLGTPTSWAWDFGDSATSTEQNPTHVYSAAGVYTVVLRAARGSSEDTETKSEYIKINFTDSITKYAYIILTPRLSTDDAAIPPSRPELRVVYADGVGNYLFIKKGVRVILPAQSSIEEGSGFARSSGPSVIFD